jgi:hypothetical protein
VTKPLHLDDPWESMTWEGAAKAQLIAGANLSLPEKLAWLDEINELASTLAENRRRVQADSGTGVSRAAAGFTEPPPAAPTSKG